MTDTIDPDKLEEAIAFYSYELSRISHPENVARATLLVDAARAHLATLPRFKEVDVWHVEYAQDGPCLAHYTSESGAHRYADSLRQSPSVSCVRVTGPHKQLVPK
ncbi:MAG TPA: hypothetical protein VGE09_08370 [Pseudoxanthomonas sp.]